MAQIHKVCEECSGDFLVYPYREKAARFCSRACYAKTVHLQKKSTKWYAVMHNRTPWNKGKEWSEQTKHKLSKAQLARCKRERINLWKGDRKEYQQLHAWVRKEKGKADACVSCGEIKPRMHWANKSGNYLKDVNDYISLCALCHNRYDKGILKGELI